MCTILHMHIRESVDTLRQSPTFHVMSTHSRAVTYLPCHVHTLSGSHLPSMSCPHTLGQSPTFHVMSTHSRAVTYLPCHVHTLSGSHLPSMSCPHTLGQSPTFHVVSTHSGSHHPPTCTHSRAVTYLPCRVHTLRQSPPSHMHTLSGSHLPSMSCPHTLIRPTSHMHTVLAVTYLPYVHHPPTCTHSGSHHPPTCTHSCPHTLRQSPTFHVMSTHSHQAVTTLPCHVTHNHAVMDPKLIIQFLQFV